MEQDWDMIKEAAATTNFYRLCEAGGKHAILMLIFIFAWPVNLQFCVIVYCNRKGRFK